MIIYRKVMETEISGLTFWLRFGLGFKNRNQTEIQFLHIPNNGIWDHLGLSSSIWSGCDRMVFSNLKQGILFFPSGEQHQLLV